MNRTLPVIALLLVTSLARADEFSVAPPGEPRPSAREQQWGEQLCAKLGAAKAETLVIGGRWSPTPQDGAIYLWLSSPADAPPARTQVEAADVRGVQVEAGGLVVRRLRFPSAESACGYVAEHARMDDGPVAVQLRGAQVVIVRGRDTTEAARRAALAAAWLVLPAPGAIEATYTAQGQGELQLSTTHETGPIAEQITEVFTQARRHANEPETFTWNGEQDVSVSMRNGVRVRAYMAEGGGYLTCTMKPVGKPVATASTAPATKPAAAPASSTTPAASPTIGAANRLEGLFGGRGR
jgi:hypothetical protein